MGPGDLGQRLREKVASGRKLLVPYLMTGYPDLETSRAALAGLAQAGADVIELGVPFSDPIADGPVIAFASQQALSRGVTLEDAIRLGEERTPADPPLVLFSYLNPLQARGLARMAAAIARAQFEAVLVADLPYDEGPEVRAALALEGLPLVSLAAPTTGESRLRSLARQATGFVYLIARTGVTGRGSGADRRLAEQVRVLREETDLPIVVGFGIADPPAARRAAQVADGIVVGSALVERLARDGVETAVEWMAALRTALDNG